MTDRDKRLLIFLVLVGVLGISTILLGAYVSVRLFESWTGVNPLQ